MRPLEKIMIYISARYLPKEIKQLAEWKQITPKIIRTRKTVYLGKCMSNKPITDITNLVLVFPIANKNPYVTKEPIKIICMHHNTVKISPPFKKKHLTNEYTPPLTLIYRLGQ